MDDKNKITGPTDSFIPIVQIAGVPICIVADLPEGGFLQIVSGENPFGIPVPGVQISKGAMLAVVPVEVATHIRPGLKQAEKAMAKGIVQNGQRPS